MTTELTKADVTRILTVAPTVSTEKLMTLTYGQRRALLAKLDRAITASNGVVPAGTLETRRRYLETLKTKKQAAPAAN